MRQTWIALLRGINVGGNNIIKMQDLRNLLDGLGLSNARTYIQSGNCVFECENSDAQSLEISIGNAIEKSHGFHPKIMVISKTDLTSALTNNPYPEANDDPKSLHLFFLSTPAVDADIATLETLQTSSERFTLSERVFYLYAPEGIGRSKLAAQAEKRLGVSATARNLRSCEAIAALVEKTL